MKEMEIPKKRDTKVTRIISGKPVISREGRIIGWAVTDGSLDYMQPGKEDIWIEIKPKQKKTPIRP
ncbi:MAG: hypothetical protein AAB542_00545 [Patescibacteria group bacterium]